MRINVHDHSQDFQLFKDATHYGDFLFTKHVVDENENNVLFRVMLYNNKIYVLEMKNGMIINLLQVMEVEGDKEE